MILGANRNKVEAIKKNDGLQFWCFLSTVIALGIAIGLGLGFLMSTINETSSYSQDTFTNTEHFSVAPASDSTPALVFSDCVIEPIVSGNCVDLASAMLFILKRNFLNFDRVGVVVGPLLSTYHCQVVLDTLDERDFLKLRNGNSVYKSTSDFAPDAPLIYLSPADFLEAVSYFKPSISKDELLAFLDEKYKSQ